MTRADHFWTVVISANAIAASFLGVESAAPRAADAQVYGVHVTDYRPDLRVKITDYRPDKRVQVAGQCSGTGSTRVKLTDYRPDERWQITDYRPDIRICLSGDLEAFYQAR
jgi:hypothetical protein